MLEAKLWHNKTEAKNVKMVEFIKTCDQYLRTFKFDNFINSIILSPFSAREKIDPQKTLFGRNG